MSAETEAVHAAGGAVDKTAAFTEGLMEHALDSHEWHLPFVHVHLPEWLSVHGLMLLICAAALFLLFGVLYRRKQDVPTGVTNLLESFVVFVRDEISIANLGEEDGRKFAPFFCSMFFFILGLNLLGIIPLFATATSNVAVTGALSLVTLMTIIGMGIIRHGPIGYMKSFAPPGVPWPILIILYPLEVFGVFIKAFALTLRLFANMLAGHLVIVSILGMTTLFGIWVAPPAVALATGIYLLELFVAFLQAYIFVLLSAMFVGASIHSEH
jgi:F-type H+-transporting ATPase subunit a